jgi:hypothetical protein
MRIFSAEFWQMTLLSLRNLEKSQLDYCFSGWCLPSSLRFHTGLGCF